jgi:hypothetical protein
MSQWRTVIAVELLGANLLAGLWIVCHTDGIVAMIVGAVFTAFAAAIVGLGTNLAVKSGVEHLANGTGIKGAWSALTTAAKPGQAATTETVTSTDVRESTVTTSQQ